MAGLEKDKRAILETVAAAERSAIPADAPREREIVPGLLRPVAPLPYLPINQGGMVTHF